MKTGYRNRSAAITFSLVMAFSATIGMFIKSIKLESYDMAMWRGILGLVALGIVLKLRGKTNKVEISRSNVIKLLVAGAGLGANWVIFTEAIKYTSIALTTLSYYFAPTLMIIGSSIILKERLTRKQIICFIASTIGVVMIIGVSGGSGTDHIGIAMALFGAVLYAATVLINKAVDEGDGLFRTIIQLIAAVAVQVPFVLIAGGTSILQLDRTGFIYLLIIGLIHTGIRSLLYFITLAKLTGQEAAIISYIEPLTSVVLSVWLLSEPLSLYQLIGGIIVLGATLINEIRLSDFQKSTPVQEAMPLNEEK